MPELPRDRFGIARSLFTDLSRLQVSAGAVLEGECHGRVVVDDGDRPRSALVTSPEGTFLAGDPENAGFVAELRGFVWQDLFGDAGWELVYATADRSSWERCIADIAAPRDTIRVGRRHYECTAPGLDGPPLVPEGFDVRAVDARMLDDERLVVPDHLRRWIVNNWGSRERFFTRGFGTATVHDGSVVSWSLCDARAGDRCEIGIQTLREYRRRGLATVTAAAAVERALASGFRVVGWHCDEDNRGSYGTAEKVGFKLERRYDALCFYAHEADELAEKGWIAFRAGRPTETLALYGRLFALRPDSPGYQYLLAARASAAIGDPGAALARLGSAIERGWIDVDATDACPEFRQLQGSPAWAALQDRMRAAR